MPKAKQTTLATSFAPKKVLKVVTPGNSIIPKPDLDRQLVLNVTLMQIRPMLYAALDYLQKVSGKKIMYCCIDWTATKPRHVTEVLPHQEIVESKKEFFTEEELVKKISMMLWYWGALNENVASMLPRIVFHYIFTPGYYEYDVESNQYGEVMHSLPGMPDHVSLLEKHEEIVTWKSERRRRLNMEIEALKRVIAKDDGVVGHEALETALNHKKNRLKQYSNRFNPALIDCLEHRTKKAVDNLGNLKDKYAFWVILAKIPQV